MMLKHFLQMQKKEVASGYFVQIIQIISPKSVSKVIDNCLNKHEKVLIMRDYNAGVTEINIPYRLKKKR